MTVQGFGKGVMRFSRLVMWGLGLLLVLALSTFSRADSSLFSSVSLLSSPPETAITQPRQPEAFAELLAAEFGPVISNESWPTAGDQNLSLPFTPAEARDLKAVLVFSDLDVAGDYEDVALTLLPQQLIVAEFADGRRPGSISLARMHEDFRDCNDLGKGATCTMKGGFLTFYENTSPIPEPETFLLVGSGVLGSGLPVFRQRRARFLELRRARTSS